MPLSELEDKRVNVYSTQVYTDEVNVYSTQVYINEGILWIHLLHLR